MSAMRSVASALATKKQLCQKKITKSKSRRIDSPNLAGRSYPIYRIETIQSVTKITAALICAPLAIWVLLLVHLNEEIEWSGRVAYWLPAQPVDATCGTRSSQIASVSGFP